MGGRCDWLRSCWRCQSKCPFLLLLELGQSDALSLESEYWPGIGRGKSWNGLVLAPWRDLSIGANCPETYPALADILDDCSAFSSLLAFPIAFQYIPFMPKLVSCKHLTLADIEIDTWRWVLLLIDLKTWHWPSWDRVGHWDSPIPRTESGNFYYAFGYCLWYLGTQTTHLLQQQVQGLYRKTSRIWKGAGLVKAH